MYKLVFYVPQVHPMTALQWGLIYIDLYIIMLVSHTQICCIHSLKSCIIPGG